MNRTLKIFALPGLVVVLLATDATRSRGGGVAPTGLSALTEFEYLPVLRQDVWFHSVSSQDVTGGNDDGFSGSFSYLYRKDGRYVLLDTRGPGCVYLFRNIGFDGNLHIQFNNGGATATETLSFADLHSDRRPPFLAPLVRDQSVAHGSSWSFVPICFQDGIVISADKIGRQRFFNIFYHLYAAGTRVETFTPRLDVRSAVDRWNSVGTPLDRRTSETTTRMVTVPSHGSAPVFASSGPGTITALFLRPAKLNHGALRHVRLRAYWDESAVPAVDSPLGPFFGTGYWPVPDLPGTPPRSGHVRRGKSIVLGRMATRSLPVGAGADGFYCFFPMPYEKSARLELVNESDEPLRDVAVTVHVVPGAPAAGSGHFHAMWREERPTRSYADYVVLDTKGHGHYVGAVLVMSSVHFDPAASRKVQRGYLEGDARFYIDDARAPLNASTGTEEYFNWGWYDVPEWDGIFSYQVSGYPVHDVDTQDHSVMYRFHLADLVPYYRSFRFALEHGGEGEVPSHYSGTAFFYQRDTPQLEMTDVLAIGDAGSEQSHSYRSRKIRWEGSRSLPFEGERQVVFTRALAGDRDGGTCGSEAEALRARGRRSEEAVEFTLSALSDNSGVKIRRLLDYSPPEMAGQELAARPQPLVAAAEAARVFIDGQRAGDWYLAPRHARLAWLEDEFELPAHLTTGKNRLRIRLEIAPGAYWSEFGYRVYSYRQWR